MVHTPVRSYAVSDRTDVEADLHVRPGERLPKRRWGSAAEVRSRQELGGIQMAVACEALRPMLAWSYRHGAWNRAGQRTFRASPAQRSGNC
jgi:hypothetical protein